MPYTLNTPKCPECSHDKSRVFKVRRTTCGKAFRKRICERCEWVFETIQEPESILTDYVKIRYIERAGLPARVSLEPLGKNP